MPPPPQRRPFQSTLQRPPTPDTKPSQNTRKGRRAEGHKNKKRETHTEPKPDQHTPERPRTTERPPHVRSVPESECQPPTSSPTRRSVHPGHGSDTSTPHPRQPEACPGAAHEAQASGGRRVGKPPKGPDPTFLPVILTRIILTRCVCTAFSPQQNNRTNPFRRLGLPKAA